MLPSIGTFLNSHKFVLTKTGYVTFTQQVILDWNLYDENNIYSVYIKCKILDQCNRILDFRLKTTISRQSDLCENR